MKLLHRISQAINRTIESQVQAGVRYAVEYERGRRSQTLGICFVGWYDVHDERANLGTLDNSPRRVATAFGGHCVLRAGVKHEVHLTPRRPMIAEKILLTGFETVCIDRFQLGAQNLLAADYGMPLLPETLNPLLPLKMHPSQVTSLEVVWLP